MRPARSRSLLVGALLLAVALVTAACSSSSDDTTSTGGTGGTGGTTKPVTVRLGYFPNVTHAPALVGLEQGLFTAKLGQNTLEPKSFNAGPDAVTALLSDALDITYIGPNPAINAFQKSNGEAVRIVSGSTSGGAYFVVSQDIAGAADLKGKTVASPQLGGTQDVALRTWLKEQGLSTDTAGGGDVSIKPQQNSDTLTAFKNGDIAGAWVPEPWATRLIQEGNGKVLVDEKTLWPQGRYVTTHLLVRTKFLEEHPDVVKAVLEAHLDALDSIAKDPAAAQKSVNDAIEKDTGKRLPDKVITASWGNLEFTADPIASSLKKSAEDAVAIGQLKDAKIEGIYDLKLLNELLVARGKSQVQGQ